MGGGVSRWTRRLLIVAAALLLIVVGLLALLQTAPVATWLGRRLVALAPLAPGTELALGRVGGNWVSGLSVEDVRLRREGRELARVRHLRLGYDPRRLLGRDRRLTELVVTGAAIHARRDSAGWDIARILRESSDTAAAGTFGIDRVVLQDLDLLAELSPDSSIRVSDLGLRARELVLGDPPTASLDTIHARILPPSDPPLWLTVSGRGEAAPEVYRIDPFRVTTDRSEIDGRAVVPRSYELPRVVDQLSVEVGARPLALADLAALGQPVRSEGTAQVDLRVETEGRRASARVSAGLDEATARLEASTLVGTGAPAEYRVTATVRDLDPSRLAASAPAGRLNAELDADVQGPRLGLADGHARLRLVDSRLGTTTLQDVRLDSRLRDGRADLELRAALDQGRIRAAGWARPFDSIPSYRLSGTATRLPGTDSLAHLLAGAEGEPFLEVGFRLSGRGASAEEAQVTGRADLTAVRSTGERSPLGMATLEIADRRVNARPELLVAGGRVGASLVARLDDPITYQLRRGTIDSVDLGRLLGDTIAAPVSGTFSLRGRGSAPAEAQVVTAIALDEIRYGERRAERVSADARLDRGHARFAMRGGLQGGRLALEGEGRPFDSVPSFTVRRAAIDSVDLGTLLGRPDLAGPVTARLAGTARWSEDVRAFSGRMRVERSTRGHIRVREGDVEVGFSGERLRYDGSLITSAGALALAGEGRPFAETPTLLVRSGRADSLDLGALLNRPGLATRLDGRFTAMAEGTAPDSMRVRLGLELLPSRVNQAEIRSGRADLTLDRGALRGELRMDAADGDLVTRIQGATAGPVRRVRAEGALRLERLARWAGDTTHDGHVAARFSLEAGADSAGLTGLSGTITANGAVDSVRLDTLQIALSPLPGAVRVDTVVLRSNVAVADGGGRAALRAGAGTDTLRLDTRLEDLAPLAALAGIDSLSLDSATLRLTVTGPPSLRRVRAVGQARRLLYAGNQVEHLALTGEAALDSNGLAAVGGKLRLEGGALGTIVVREAELAGRYDSLVALQARAVLRDSIALDAALRGTAKGDTIEATLERLNLSEGGRKWALERPTALALRPRQVEIDHFGLRAGDHRLALNGLLDRGGESDVAFEVRRLDLDLLRQLGFAPVGGTLDGNLRLTGPAATPSLRGKILATVRPEDGTDLSRILSELDWTATGLRIDATASHDPGGRLTIAGTLPLRLTLAPADTAETVGVTRQPDDTLGLVIRADSFDLAFAEPFLPAGTAEELGGTMAIDGRISGTIKAPRAEGTVSLTRFGATLTALGVRYDRGELLGRLSGDRFRLERLRLITDNDGELTARGDVGLTPMDDPSLDLTAELREFRVSHSATLRTIASGQLRLQGTAAAPALTGDLQLGRTEMFTGTETAAAAGVEEVRLTPEDLQRVARQFGPAAIARANEGPGLVDRFKLELDVRFPRRVWFRRRETPKMDIEVAGRIQVKQEPGQPMQFFGEVAPMPGRGSIELYGREFRLTDGEITLAGPVEATTLDVTVQYQVPTQADPGDDGILIDVAASGRPDSLRLDFTSEPTMSQEDIVSYIVTGRPASENPLAGGTGGESATQVGADIALTRLSESVSGAAGEALGLDVFQIRQDGLRGLTLTAGRYIASRLFLSLQQPIQLSSDAQQSSSAALGPGFELEYSARRWLRANLRGGNAPARFLIRGRHAF